MMIARCVQVLYRLVNGMASVILRIAWKRSTDGCQSDKSLTTHVRVTKNRGSQRLIEFDIILADRFQIAIVFDGIAGLDKADVNFLNRVIHLAPHG